MKLAVIADIHGNHLALEAVLNDIEKQNISDVLNLGDCLSGPLEAEKTANLLMKNNFPTVRGNHDRQLLDTNPDEMGQSDAFAFDQLSQKHLDWLGTFPETIVYKNDVFMCHGTPRCDNVYWMENVLDNAEVVSNSQETIEHYAQGIDCSLILCGHTHIPKTCLLSGGRMLVNPGSVGCPGYDDETPIYHKVQTGNPNACYAIVENTQIGWDVTFRQLTYDNMKMSVLAKQNRRPEWASALATGWV